MRGSTCRCTSRHLRSARWGPASRSARMPPGCSTVWVLARRSTGRGCDRWAFTSGGGTTAAPCSGRPLGEAMEAAFGAPYYHFHRADLLRALAEALPAERVQLDHRLTSFKDQGDGVELTFANGRSEERRVGKEERCGGTPSESAWNERDG